MGFNWDDDDTFRDIPDEVVEGQDAPMPIINAGNVRPQQPPQNRTAVTQSTVESQDQALLEAVLEEGEEDIEAVLADANLRIELATLYKLIMNHDLFDGMDVDPRAVDTVHREIRRFARERMEIMLGMRQEKEKESFVSSPFSDLEVVVLRKLASTFSKGATEQTESKVVAPTVTKPSPRKEGLNTIGVKPAAKPNPVAKKQQQLNPKKQAPLERPAKPQQSNFKEEDYKPIGKPLHELTTDEMLKRNKEVSDRQASRKTAKSATALPMPTPDQEAMFQEHRVLQSDHPLANPNAVNAIVSALNKSKSQ